MSLSVKCKSLPKFRIDSDYRTDNKETKHATKPIRNDVVNVNDSFSLAEIVSYKLTALD